MFLKEILQKPHQNQTKVHSNTSIELQTTQHFHFCFDNKENFAVF